MAARAHRYERNSRNPVMAASAAMVTGAALTAATIALPTILSIAESSPWTDPLLLIQGALWLLYVFVISLIPWIVGVAVVAPPIWFLLHRVGLRGPVAAVMAGASLAALTLAGLTGMIGLSTTDSPIIMLFGAVTGGAAGFSLWRVAYRRADCGANVS